MFDGIDGRLDLDYQKHKTELDKPNFQGYAAVNYTDREALYTRIIEHERFRFGKDDAGERVILGDWLGEYRYYDMDQVIAMALERSWKES